jgi:hypothetical protein
MFSNILKLNLYLAAFLIGLLLISNFLASLGAPPQPYVYTSPQKGTYSKYVKGEDIVTRKEDVPTDYEVEIV